ncbi:MAG: enoyl-CoA hydratase/isomerase family protein [Bacteriovoracaceae bacterium]|nr:enoyl-CoA hydratase/isomerase family protein [Bacteriovoracaceae bacterium]
MTINIKRSLGIVTATISRPEKLNALNRDVLMELQNFFQSEIHQPWHESKVIILTGEGEKAFVAGADIAAMSDMDSESALSFSLLGHKVNEMIENFPRPVIACVNGHALGGGLELALACDIIYAATSGQWGIPEAKLGVIPGFGGWARLVQSIGVARSKWLAMTGESFSSSKMLELGIVQEIFPDVATLRIETENRAKKISMNGPLALKAIKKMGKTSTENLARESQMFASLFSTDDQKEGMAAFIERRPSQFISK